MRTGARLLPFVDDFAVFANGFDESMRRKNETLALVNILGLDIHLTKGYHTITQAGEHLCMEMDFEKAVFRGPARNSETFPCSPRTYCVLQSQTSVGFQSRLLHP
jgi:hypothetical protein